MKLLNTIYSPPNGHWVGDGFPVRSLFSYDRMGAENVSPFLLLDYAGPAEFPAANQPRGVGQHPHRGFETVTLVYEGELEHRDSSGGGGLIGAGDVQWMTAGAGIVHEEFHSQDFTKTGGTLEMVQLWVNLPAKDKDTPATYQNLLDADMPRVPIGSNDGHLRVVAGSYLGHRGPANTFTDIDVWDMHLRSGDEIVLPALEGRTTLLVALSGKVQLNGQELLREAELAHFDRKGNGVELGANTDARLLLLSGEPIAEPVVGHGPFVMNSADEIQQTIADFRNGQFAAL